MTMVFAKRGYKNHYVELVQRRMRKEIGDPWIADDGDFGPKTEEAVKLFQLSRYLKDHVIIGVFTDACLFGKGIETSHKRPAQVHLGNTNRCWAAAT